MLDISTEITAFKKKKKTMYGEDVRDAMVSLVNKLNNVLSGTGVITMNMLQNGCVTSIKLSTNSISNDVFLAILITSYMRELKGEFY